jgi:hypothetical protein
MLRGALAMMLVMGCAGQRILDAKDPCGDQYGNCIAACRDRSRGNICADDRTFDLTCMRPGCVLECDRVRDACLAGEATTATELTPPR